MLTSTPRTIFLKDYAAPAFLVSSVDLDVDLRDDHALVKTKLAITRNPESADLKAPLELDGDELVEITPKSIRIRKRHLKEHERKRASRDTTTAAA